MTEQEKKAHFLNLYAMIMADGVVHPKEMETVYRIGIENYKLTPSEISENLRESSVEPFVPQMPEDRVRMLYDLAIIAWADGELDPSERELLRRYCTLYEVNEDDVDELTDFLLEKAHDNESVENVINHLN